MFNSNYKIARISALVVGTIVGAIAAMLLVCICRMVNVGQALVNAVGYTNTTLVEYYWSYMLPEYYYFVVELIGIVVELYFFYKIVEDVRWFDDPDDEEA